MKKKLVLLIITISLFICMISVKAEVYSRTAVPLNIELGKTYELKTYYEEIDEYTYNTDYNQKLVLDSRGILKISINKSLNDEGKVNPFRIQIWDKNYNNDNGKRFVDLEITDTKSKTYEYNIGLDKGTYYINYSVNGNTITNLKTIYTFTKTDYAEIEENNVLADAKSIKLGKKYTGYIGKNELVDSSSNGSDYYKIKLKKNKVYLVNIDKLKKMEANLCIRLEDHGECRSLETENGKSFIFVAAQDTGYYTLEIHSFNDKIEKYTFIIKEIASSLADAKVVGIKDKTYTGKEVLQNYDDVKIKIGGVTRSVYFKKTTNNVNVGKATVVIKSVDGIKGEITKYFYILPKSTKINEIQGIKKGINITWKKQKVQTTGYQIEYSLNKDFSKSTKVLIKKNKITNNTINKLKSKKKYYVRIRTYKLVDAKKIYSNWSKIKIIKTK